MKNNEEEKKARKKCFLFLISHISTFNDLDFLNLKGSHFSENKKTLL